MSEMLKLGAIKAAEFTYGVCQKIGEGAQAIFEFPVEVITLQGQMRGGKEGEDITLLYVGRSLNLPHFKKKFFVEAKTVHHRRANLITYGKHMNAAKEGADVLFVDIGWPYYHLINRHGEYLELPDWVCLGTKLADTWDGTVQNFRKTMRKNIKRLIRKNEYRCEKTNDPATIKAFYDDYYKAFINSRHAGEVFMTPRISIERRAREGVILQVIGKDGPVAAGVYFPYGDDLCLLVTGMPEALLENPPEAAVAALYYFSLEYAFDNGFEAVNFMGTRSFPNDGLFQFKRKWGAEVKDIFSIDAILFRPLNNSPKAARFCELFPLVARKGKNLELVLCTTAPELSKEDCDRLVANSHCAGLDPVKIVHVTDKNTTAVRQPTGEKPTVQVVNTTLASLSQNYTGDSLPASEPVKLERNDVKSIKASSN